MYATPIMSLTCTNLAVLQLHDDVTSSQSEKPYRLQSFHVAIRIYKGIKLSTKANFTVQRESATRHQI